MSRSHIEVIQNLYMTRAGDAAPTTMTQKVGQSIKLLTALLLPIIYLEIPECIHMKLREF